MAGPIRIAVLANASQARRELDGIAGTADRIGNRFSKFRAPAVAALGGLAFAGKKAIDAASDLNENLSKTTEIFGPQSDAIKKWAATADTSLGLSNSAALDAAANFGLIGQKAGLGGKQTAAFSKKFTGLAADLASFNNTTPEEAITAIGAAMRGESEPIRRYGVLLDDATLRARAMRMGLIKTTKEALTPQQKALAASQEILAQTSKAQGDFARTSDSAANRQRILAAQAENTAAKFGKGLLPAYEAVLGIASKFATFMADHPALVKGAALAIAGLSVAVLALSAATKVVTAAMTIYKAAATAIKIATIAWRNAQFALNLVLMANPIGLVVLAIAGLVAAFVLAYKKSDKFRKLVHKVWDKIKDAAKKVWDGIKKVILTYVKAIKLIFTTYIKVYKKIFTTAWDVIKTVTKTAWKLVRDYIIEPIKRAYQKVRDTLRSVKSFIGDTWRAISSNVREVVRNVAGFVRDAWNTIRSKTREIWDGIRTAIRDKVNTAMEFIRGIKSRVTGVFSNAASWLWDAGQEIIRGLIDGIESMIGAVKDKLSSVTDLIPDWKGPRERDKKLLTPAGELIMEGLVTGIDRALPKLRKKLKGVTKEVQGFTAGRTGEGFRVTAKGELESRSSLAGVGGNTYTITVNVPVGASSADIGRVLVKHIDAYERTGGRRRA